MIAIMIGHYWQKHLLIPTILDHLQCILLFYFRIDEFYDRDIFSTMYSFIFSSTTEISLVYYIFLIQLIHLIHES